MRSNYVELLGLAVCSSNQTVQGLATFGSICVYWSVKDVHGVLRKNVTSQMNSSRIAKWAPVTTVEIKDVLNRVWGGCLIFEIITLWASLFIPSHVEDNLFCFTLRDKKFQIEFLWWNSFEKRCTKNRGRRKMANKK